MQDLVRSCVAAIKPYEPGKPIEEVQRELGLTDVVKMASNENPLGPSPRALRAVAEALPDIFYYPEGSGRRLRHALAERLELAPENLILGNGADELLKVIPLAFLREGEEVIIAEHSFTEYTLVTRLLGGRPVYVPRRGLRYDLERMAEAISGRTKLIFVSNPCNPTGTMVGQAEAEALLARVPERVLVVFDEAYREFASAPDFPDLLPHIRSGRRNLIVLRTFSKAYGLAGLRVGYGIAHPELIGWLNRVRDPFNVNSLAQVAALAALDDQEHVEKTQKIVWEGREYLYRALEAMGLRYEPTQANFILVDVGRDCRRVFHELLKEGVIVRPADIFDLPTCVRVTVGTAEQNRRFIEALGRVLDRV
ncbi:MAG: histidinol-phosphate transaminase [Clostridia bacterium]|jgi:histidinol-phosphate aminotransferase|nr:histidinol-phosphate transaminase [Clostridia bacterium]